MEAPVAFPLAPGFIEVSVHGNFDLRAGPANISKSAVARPFRPREVRKMRIARNLDFAAGSIAFLVAAVALPPLPTEREESVSRSEEHTSELPSRGLISYAGFCLKKKKKQKKIKKKNKKRKKKKQNI